MTRLALKRKRLELPDGDFLDLDFLRTSRRNGKKDPPLVVILHGLSGSSRAPYVQSLLRAVRDRGWEGVAVNMRMCSGEPNRLKETYHSGKSEDLNSVVRYLREVCDAQRILVAGFSIGGNLMLKWLGEQGEEAAGKISAAVAVSVPYDLAQSVGLMDRGFNREVYTRALLKDLKSKVVLKEQRFPGIVRLDRVKRCRTFAEFDREVTAPLNGFRDERDYWSQSSCKGFLTAIRVSTLLVHAEDDPFFPGRLLPRDEIRNSPYLKSLFVRHGGHLGFVSGAWPWKPARWLENTLLNFFAGSFEK